MEMFGRSNDPKCDTIYWDKPVKESCPSCKNEECDYKMPVDSAETTPVNETEATAHAA